MLWASPCHRLPMALHPSSCNLSCTATGSSQEAAANHAALYGDFVLPQNIPTMGCGELIARVLPCKLTESEPQPPRAMMSSFNPQRTKLQVLNLLCWESDFVIPEGLLFLVGSPSWVTTAGTFPDGEVTWWLQSSLYLQAFLLKKKVVNLAAIPERFWSKKCKSVIKKTGKKCN